MFVDIYFRGSMNLKKKKGNFIERMKRSKSFDKIISRNEKSFCIFLFL